MLQLSLLIAGLAFLYVGGVSWNAGYGPEVAVLRGLLAFMAVSAVGYVGALIVATAPPPRASAQAGSDEAADRSPLDAAAGEAGASAGPAAVPEIGLAPAADGETPARALTPAPAGEERRAA